VMIASLAEPAMLMIVFTLALLAGSTQLSTMAAFLGSDAAGLRVSLGLALIDLSAELKLLLYVSLIACPFVPWGIAPQGAGLEAHLIGLAAYVAKLGAGGFLLAVFETSIAKMRVFR